MFNDYDEAMAAHTRTEACVWMENRIRVFLQTWQGADWDRARGIVSMNLAYVAGIKGSRDQERVYELYGAVHPLVLSMSQEERKGRVFLYEFSAAEIGQVGMRLFAAWEAWASKS